MTSCRSGTTHSKSSKFTSTISVTKSLANHLNGKRLHGCSMDQVTPYIVEAIKGECSTKYCRGYLKTKYIERIFRNIPLLTIYYSILLYSILFYSILDIFAIFLLCLIPFQWPNDSVIFHFSEH